MFHAALWKLIRLQWRGRWRQFWRNLWTIRGMFLLGLELLGLGSFVFTMYFKRQFDSSTPRLGLFAVDGLSDYVALGLFVFTILTVLFSTGVATVCFTVSEVAFLFPAPFTRRQLLSYKLLKSLFGIVVLSLFMPLAIVSSLWMWGVTVLGSVLSLSFLQLVAMNVAFLRQVLQERVHVWLRRLCGYGVSIVVLLATIQTIQQLPEASFPAMASGFLKTPAGACLLAPFQIFARTIVAPDFLSFLPFASLALAIDTILLVIAFRLDGLSLEAALAISEKMSARLKQMQAKGVWHVLGSSSSGISRRRIPHPPFWAGVGPIVWQKMTTTFRMSLKLLWLLMGAVVTAGSLTYGIHHFHPDQPGAPMIAVVAMAYFSFFVSLTQQNEIERIGYLKSLPIHPVSIVLGELLGFIVLLSFVQAALFLVLCCVFPAWSLWLAWAAVLTLPFNSLLFGIDKLVFYIYPTRLAMGAPGDFQNAGRQMIFMSLKMLIAGLGFALAIAAAIPGAVIFQSPVAALVPTSIVLVLECVALVPLLTMAFNRFDPGPDMPA